MVASADMLDHERCVFVAPREWLTTSEVDRLSGVWLCEVLERQNEGIFESATAIFTDRASLRSVTGGLPEQAHVWLHCLWP